MFASLVCANRPQQVNSSNSGQKGAQKLSRAFIPVRLPGEEIGYPLVSACPDDQIGCLWGTEPVDGYMFFEKDLQLYLIMRISHS